MVAHATPSNFTCSVLPSSPTYLATLLTIWLTYLPLTTYLHPRCAALGEDPQRETLRVDGGGIYI